MATDLPDLDQLLAPVLADDDLQGQQERLEALCAAHPASAEALRRQHRILVRLGFAVPSESSAALFPPPPAPPPERFGRFRIVRRLGRGGMGVVYLAEDPEHDRQVALKLIRPELLDSKKARERFRREVAAATKLEHPNISTVHDTGELDGQPYLVMRYVEGESLEERLRRARAAGREVDVDPRPALLLVERLARALHEAHELSLVHRDIKPANVMVTAGDQPVLLDFGLARDTDSSAVSLTQSHDPVGTPVYMAPEQIRGAAVDRRTDVYALGALLYECLTLRPPLVGRDREELYRRILHEPPLDLRRLQPAASRDLATLVHKALAKSAAQRYPTALALAEDLRAVLDGRPTRARPPGALALALGWTRRHRAATTVAAALLVGLGLALVFLLQRLAAEARFEALALMAKAAEVRPEDPELAFLALREALDVLSPEPEVMAAIQDVLPELQEWDLVREASGRVQWIERSPTGKWFVASGPDIPATLHRADGSVWAELPVLYHTRPALAFSPDDERLVLAFREPGKGTVRAVRYDLTGKDPEPIEPELGVLPGLAIRAAWSRTGTILLTFSNLDRALLYDASTGTLLQTIQRGARGESGGPLQQGAAFLSDGRIVLPGGIWSADGAERLAGLPVDGVVQFIEVHGDRIAIATRRGVRVFDDRGRALGEGFRREVVDAYEFLSGMQWAPDGSAIAVSYTDGLIHLLDDRGRHTQSWKVHETDLHVPQPQWTPDSRYVLTGDWAGRVTVWDRQGDPVERWRGNKGGTLCAPIGADAASLLIGSWDHTVRIWRRRPIDGVPLRSGFPVAYLLRTPQGLVASTGDGRVRLLDRTGEALDECELDGPGLIRVDAHRDEESVWLIQTRKAAIWRWRPNGAAPVRVADLADREPRIPTLAHLGGGRLLLGSWYPVAMRLLDPATGELHSGGEVPSGLVAALPDGGALSVTAMEGRHLVVRHGPDGGIEDRRPDDAAQADAVSLVIDEEGRRAAIGREDGSVTLWDVVAKAPVARWTDHQTRVGALAFAPDGRHLASVSPGHLVIRSLSAADPPPETPLLSWRSDQEGLRSAAFVDEQTLITSGSAGLRWWHWQPEPLRRAMDRIALQPTEEQLKRIEALRQDR